MKQEDKELLLKDLCCRLPYGVKTLITGDWFYDEEEAHEYTLTVQNDRKLAAFARGELDMKPYLRPMSSMTEEEFVYFMGLRGRNMSIYDIQEMMKKAFEHHNSIAIVIPINNYLGKIDWLNAHHFDYRCLIEKGLAIDCTNLNIY